MGLEDKEGTAAGSSHFLTMALGLGRCLLACAPVWGIHSALGGGPSSSPGVEQQDAPRPGLGVKAVCRHAARSPGLTLHLCIPVCPVFPLHTFPATALAGGSVLGARMGEG